jgi:hypothetical protein
MVPPGDLSTVHTTLLQLKVAANNLGQTTVPVSFLYWPIDKGFVDIMVKIR